MAQYRFVVNGDFVEFYDGAQLVNTYRNTYQNIDWYYDNSESMSFNLGGYYYYVNSPSQIEIDGDVLSAYSEFDAAIGAIFSGVAGDGSGSSLFPTAGEGTPATDSVVGNLGGNTFAIESGDEDFLFLDPTPGAEEVRIRAFNNTGGGNEGKAYGTASNTGSVVSLYAGFDNGNVEGEIQLTNNGSTVEAVYRAYSHTFNGAVILPTSDPGVEGALWNNAGTPAISTGP